MLVMLKVNVLHWRKRSKNDDQHWFVLLVDKIFRFSLDISMEVFVIVFNVDVSNLIEHIIVLYVANVFYDMIIIVLGRIAAYPLPIINTSFYFLVGLCSSVLMSL